MKRTNKQSGKRRILAAVVAGVIIFVMIFGTIIPMLINAAEPAKETAGSSQITINGTVGFNNRYKANCTTRFLIDLKNNGNDFKGKAQVKIDVSDIDGTSRFNIYSVQLELPAGSAKQVDLDIPLVTAKTYFEVVLLDEKGAQAASKKLTCKGATPETIFAGVLTDNPEGLNYLKNLELNNYSYMGDDTVNRALADNVFFLDSKTLPGNSKPLDAFAMIIIDDYDTQQLSDEQINALIEWTSTGGVLILGTGAGYDKVMKKIPASLIDVTHNGTVPVHSFKIADTYTLGNKTGKPVVIENLTAKNANHYLNEEGVNFTSALNYNQGSVVLHPFGLAVEPFATLEGRDRFLAGLYKSLVDTRYHLKSYYNYMDLSYLTNNLPSLNDNKLVLIYITVFAYAGFIGPVLYLILKKKDKREYGFVIIPAFAVAVTLTITLISSDSAYKKPITHTLSRISLADGQTSGEVSLWTGVFAPKKGNVRVSFDQNIPVTINPNSYNYYRTYSRSVKNQDVVEIESGDTPGLRFFNSQSWSPNNFSYASHVSLNEGFVCDFYLEDGTLKGTVTNNTGYDWPEIIVGIRNSVAKYENLKNGEKAEINQKITFDSQYFDMYQAFQTLYGDVHAVDSGYTNEEKRQIMFKQNLLSNMQELSMKYSSSYAMPARYYTSTSPRAMAVSVASSSVQLAPETRKTAPVNVDIYGFNYEKLDDVEVSVNNQLSNDYYTNVLYLSVPLNIESMKKFDFPSGLISVSEINTAVPYDQGYGNELYLREAGDVEMSFTLFEGVKVETFTIQWSQMFGGKEIYNVKDDSWEELSSSAYTKTAMDYVSREGNIKVRILGAEASSLFFPQISVKGEQ